MYIFWRKHVHVLAERSARGVESGDVFKKMSGFWRGGVGGKRKNAYICGRCPARVCVCAQ